MNFLEEDFAAGTVACLYTRKSSFTCASADMSAGTKPT